MCEVSNKTIVIDRGARVDDAMRADTRARIHNGPCHNDRPRPDFCMPRHLRRRMNCYGECRVTCREVRRAQEVVADGNDHGRGRFRQFKSCDDRNIETELVLRSIVEKRSRPMPDARRMSAITFACPPALIRYVTGVCCHNNNSDMTV